MNTLNTETALGLAAQCGFDHWGPLNMAALAFMPEVRAMCAENLCGCYGVRWSCPPACGSLDEIRLQAKACTWGILVQTTGQLEDDFDYESMMKAEARHKQNFLKLAEWMRSFQPDCMPMTAGSCSLCESCTCPDAPCRQPQRMLLSMEACGLMVSDICGRSGLAYYYGPRTVTFTSCVLLK